mgnify:CR=1 FL=1
MTNRRILYLGNFTAPWCSEVHIARDFEYLGHDVVRLQEPPGGGSHATLAELEEQATGADLVLWTRTWGLPPEATALWRRLEANGVQTASLHLDLYRGLARQKQLKRDPFWSTGHVFTPDGDPASAEFFASLGINHRYSAPAVVSDECVPGNRHDRYDFDVVFVGSYGYHPEWPWRTHLIDHLADRYGPRFRRFGGDLPEGPTRGQDLNDLYATARVVVGDSLCPPGHTRYWTDRYYETVGRGGFLIAPEVPGIEEHFDDGEHLRFYTHGDLDQIDSLVDHYVANPEEARLIANNGQAHVAANHTYKHRLAALLDTIGLG